MALAAKGCDGNNLADVKEMLSGWVTMEDTDFCRDLLRDEVSELMDICQLKEVVEDDDDQ